MAVHSTWVLSVTDEGKILLEHYGTVPRCTSGLSPITFELQHDAVQRAAYKYDENGQPSQLVRAPFQENLVDYLRWYAKIMPTDQENAAAWAAQNSEDSERP